MLFCLSSLNSYYSHVETSGKDCGAEHEIQGFQKGCKHAVITVNLTIFTVEDFFALESRVLRKFVPII